jgi:hypothetical protein
LRTTVEGGGHWREMGVESEQASCPSGLAQVSQTEKSQGA